MEEFVGKHWHRFITRRAQDRYPEAVVNLDEIRQPLALLFRAFGGDGGLKIEAARPEEHGARRSLLQRLAGSGKHAALAWRDAETLRLPAEIDLYPRRELNRDLYFWLAALAAIDSRDGGDWFRANQQRTLSVLTQFPGLRARYQRLIAAELSRRPDPSTLPKDEAHQESAIQQALKQPGGVDVLPNCVHPPQPIYLWLHPNPPRATSATHADSNDSNHDEADNTGKRKEAEQPHRYRAEQTEMPDGKDGLITMRWENIFSWAEYLKVHRATEEDEDDNAADTARDMDVITVARDQQSSASRLRLDLDLPSAQYDDIPLSGAITVPEWDWRKQQLLPDRCRIQPMLPRGSHPQPLPPTLQRTARKLRGQFAALARQRIWLRNQPEGCELDLSAYLDHVIDRQTGAHAKDGGLYRDLRQNQRDLATLLLADLSLSTDAAINNEQRVIDAIRDSLLLFAEALNACGDRHAIYGFSSRRREQVRFYHLKSFTEHLNDDIRGRIQAIRPGYYTRMGAAIRHASALLGNQAAHQRLLLILTDGKPNDLDRYEGRYGVEDTRMALNEARAQGLIPFCITIDRQADDYLPHLFGRHGYTVIHRPQELPSRLLALYTQLSSV
ncbi:MAG: VWA domain-containing protein [Pseudomonadota bacterium]